MRANWSQSAIFKKEEKMKAAMAAGYGVDSRGGNVERTRQDKTRN